MPGLCREYVSSFDDCIPLETLSYEQLNGVSFSGVNILWTIIKYVFESECFPS